MRKVVSTVIINKSEYFRRGLLSILAKTQYKVIASVHTLADVKTSSLSQARPLIFLVDLDKEDSGSISEIKAIHPGARVVVISDQFTPWHASLVRKGADGYLLSVVSPDVLIKSLDLVMHGESVFSSRIFACAEEDGPAPVRPMAPTPEISIRSESLSNRESEILRSLVQGESNKVIARRLDITEATVKVHMKAILRKIGVRNRTQAAVWALDHYPIPPSDRPPILLNGA